MDHAPEDHVVEGVQPEGSQQDKELRDECEGGRLLVLGGGGAQGEGDEFPGGAHDDDPAEADFLVQYGLVDVGAEGEAEEDGEENGGGEGGAVVPLCVTGPFGDVAVWAWRYVYTCCGR